MATLAANQPRAYAQGDIEAYPVQVDVIYEGAAVGENGFGTIRPLVAGDPFLGFALEQVDNSAGAAGDLRVRVRTKGRVELDVAGSAISSNDRPAVYASDDDTFTLTSTSNSLIGYVSQWVSGTTCIVEFDAALAKAALQA